jgi:hypothetical protein
MLCPACASEMIILELHDVEIDWCPRCRGIWLDEGELELLVEPQAGLPSSPVLQALREGQGAGRGERRCPACRKAMSKVVLSLDAPVEIDQCPQRHGLWLDDGELQQICRGAGAEPVAGFLGEIFGGNSTNNSNE